MVRKAFLVLLCFIGLIMFVSTLHGQGTKKTITLPSGEVVCDLNGEWDVFDERYGPWDVLGNYQQMYKITQTGSSFVAVRMIDDSFYKKGSKVLQGELDKCRIKKVTIYLGENPIVARGKISDDGNKLVIDDFEKIKITATRK